jgi:branched-chain amino acid transport system permease protein
MQGLQAILDGVIAGMPVALLALAFTIAYMPARVFFVALGGIYVAVPYITKAVADQTGWWALAVPAGLLSGSFIAALCELLNHRLLALRGASPGAHLVSSLGIYMVLVQAVALIWGNDAQVLRQGLDHVFPMGPLSLATSQVVSMAVSCTTFILFWIWLRATTTGPKMRAMADNPRELAIRGFNIHRLRLLAFALAGLLASGAALLTARDVGFDPNCGLPALLLAVVASIIGGRGSFAGPIVGGLILALARSATAWFLSAQWTEAATFAILVGILYVRPNGLFAARGRLEATA